MESCMRDLVPLKSSLSVVLSGPQVWSNAPDCLKSEDFDSLNVFAQKLVEQRWIRNELTCECDKKKKTRQVFTFSQPPEGVVDFNGDVEVYESSGGQEGLLGMEPHMRESSVAKQKYQPSQAVPNAPQLSPICAKANSADPAIYPQFALPHVRSECGVKSCLPCPDKASLFYSVSDSSLPILKTSSLFNKVSSQVQVFEAFRSTSCTPLNGSFSSGLFRQSKFKMSPNQRRSTLIDRHKDILIRYTKMDEDLARKIAEAIQQVKAERGKFMSYAKFSSSFKLSEVFYEGVNSRSITHMPSMMPPLLIHRMNPDYDENQSITEALTVIKSLSSITSLSRITRVCRLVSSQDLKSRVDFGWIKSTISHCEGSRMLEPSVMNGAESISPPLASIRNRQFFTLGDSLKNNFGGEQKETDIWSSASTTPKSVSPMPKRLVDVISPSCIFRTSLVEAMKRPLWQLKTPNLTKNRTDQVNDFIFKAHNYMHVRDRPNFHKCFFQPRPYYRVVDECVQFPDVAPVWDRSVEKPQSENSAPDLKLEHGVEESNLAVRESSPVPSSRSNEPPTVASLAVTVPSDKVTCSTSMIQTEPSLTTSLRKTIPVQSKNASLAVTVSRDKVTYSTSRVQIVSSLTTSMRTTIPVQLDASIPGSTSSNKYPSSMDYLTSSSLTSQPKQRKIVKAKLETVVEQPISKCQHPSKHCSKPNQFCRSYPAFCDKRKIRIKYDNGHYTVLKEAEKPKRRTIWSILTGKATHLLKAVAPRERHRHSCRH